MSQKSYVWGKDGEFVIDLGDDDDDFDIPSEDEIEISEDQRIMEEMIQMERDREARAQQATFDATGTKPVFLSLKKSPENGGGHNITHLFLGTFGQNRIQIVWITI